jgi:GH15 family glucan-1,4-alpha-glucosidase
VTGWRSWSELHRGYDGFAAEQVRRGALVLQSLTFQPTGAIVAAATTSLPEIVGGGSNWDYRYGWLRDSSITLKALWISACPDEAERYFRWMALASGSGGEDHVQIMFGLQGERDLTERHLEHLRGYQGSRPVRVGNDAWKQRQLDVLGEVLEAAWTLRDQLDFDDLTAAFLRRLADDAARSWRLPDSGVWEGREGERHYTASKLMCWVALDRACRLATQLKAHDRLRGWEKARDEIAAAIMEQGWDDKIGAFTGAFGSSNLDAAGLLMPLVGFLPATDPRVRRTVDTLQRELGDDGLLLRWTGAQEGAFVICSYWLAECLALAGEADRARHVFDRVGAHANDLGLLSEQVDPASGQLLSNFPQTFSHAGLINAAWAIEQTTSNQRTRDRKDAPWAGSPTG